MKKKHLCMILTAYLALSYPIAAFATTSVTETTPTAVTTPSAEKTSVAETTSSAEKTSVAETTSSAVTTTAEATTPAAATINLSLEEAIKIMKTTGASAETAKLHKQSDIAVGNGYSENVSKIKTTQDNLDALFQAPDAWVKAKYDKYAVEMAYEAQVEGVSSNNKKIMKLRRNFARENMENNYQAELNQIEADTISLYYKVLLAQDNFNISKENLTTKQKTLKNIELKKSVGLLSKKDVLQAKSSVAEAESAVRSAETQLKYAKMSFNYLLGYNVQKDIVFTDTLENIESDTNVIEVETAVKNALNNRIELKGANLAVQIYEILLAGVKDYPENSSTYLGAEINLAESQKTLKDAYSKMEIDIRNKYNLVQDKKAEVEAAKNLLAYATEGERLVTLTNEEGLATVEELLASQVNLYKAKLNLANANSEYALAIKNYEFAQGVGTTRISL